MTLELRKISDAESEALWEGEGYAEYIMENCGGDRIICNGDTLIEAMEDNYLFDEYLESLNLTL
ncbi:hypothetical protein UFOVP58_176 [uncultured Caudovirales phage]|uniref:Uncharacterized protein n=1 Tax=uncultured Caudovirales phage TaxID=2100421 RepID=A0A6J5KSW0_9CAUD|nr:hypothetical protein UFOVP58_176 [uncultured Caudovirales phage]